MERENKKTLKFFSRFHGELKSEPEEVGIADIKSNDKKREKLRKTAAKARMDGRLDAIMKGEEFNESETPPEELENIDEKIVDAIVANYFDNIIGG
jgi:hypothetical protein